MKNETNDALQSDSRASNGEGLYCGPSMSELNHKGDWCYFIQDFLCQEGYCSECNIFQLKVHGLFKT